jgi:hypothetical protein
MLLGSAPVRFLESAVKVSCRESELRYQRPLLYTAYLTAALDGE